MITCNDILELAWAVEETAKKIAERGGYDIRNRIVIDVDGKPVEIRSIDRDLYRMTHDGNMDGHKPCDTINATLAGTRFVIETAKEHNGTEKTSDEKTDEVG